MKVDGENVDTEGLSNFQMSSETFRKRRKGRERRRGRVEGAGKHHLPRVVLRQVFLMKNLFPIVMKLDWDSSPYSEFP